MPNVIYVKHTTETNVPAADETAARREFLAQLGKAAVTAPAVAILLTASAQPRRRNTAATATATATATAMATGTATATAGDAVGRLAVPD